MDPVGQAGDGGGGGRTIGHRASLPETRLRRLAEKLGISLVQASEDTGDWRSATFPGTLRDVIIEIRKVKH
ncbi:hypothetical protein Amsp01_070030 [Amycolatopsis sp. NBRC 101858]|nr:hypothetical protein Amsp01_070030 [Amycolatopsis sp. NBRC 101858]